MRTFTFKYFCHLREGGSELELCRLRTSLLCLCITLNDRLNQNNSIGNASGSSEFEKKFHSLPHMARKFTHWSRCCSTVDCMACCAVLCQWWCNTFKMDGWMAGLKNKWWLLLSTVWLSIDNRWSKFPNHNRLEGRLELPPRFVNTNDLICRVVSSICRRRERESKSKKNKY